MDYVSSRICFSSAYKRKIIIQNIPLSAIAEKIPTPLIETKTEQESDETINDNLEWIETYDVKFKIKMLNTGEFHGDEVKAKSGENWLGLFRKGEEFFLRSTKINIKKVTDEFVDEKPNQKTGKEVSIKSEDQPIFLLKNAGFLKQGNIKTLFYGDLENSDDNVNINNKTNRTFHLNGVTYNLFVTSNKVGKGEYLDKTSKLILSDGKIEQVIYSQKMCDDCGWAIYWAGDLDNDGKLDLYLDLHNHYNVEQRRLFLSSQAESGKLVKEVANFRIVGC